MMYSLMERTVEGELTTMAVELGLGVLPWGPLKSGALTGKYIRANGVKMPGLQGARIGDLTEKQYDIIDAVGKIATECNTDSSTLALAWLGEFQGHHMLIIELPVAGEGFRFRAVDAEADRSIKPDGDLLLGHDRKIDPPDSGGARGAV